MYHVKYQMKEFAMENTFFFNNFKTLASDEKCKKRLFKENMQNITVSSVHRLN